MIFYRFYLLVETSARKQAVKEDRQKYVSFDYAALFEESYLFLLAFISFVATVKFLKLLRFNKKMNVLGHTLLYIARPFVSFMFTMLMVFVAYSHMAFLVFNTLLLSFSSFTSSMSTLFTLMLNKFDYKSMERANPLFAPFIFLTFTVVMGFMLINFMLSLIIEGFTSVNADLEGKPNKYEIVDFVIGKFKAVLGFGSDTMPAVRDKKEDFIEDSQKELDMKFGEFSERVFGMFLQDVEDIKDMKAAENLINRERSKDKERKFFTAKHILRILEVYKKL
ncbi:PKD1L2 [Bugula neritina]|uniref:PKD1L2 n=1 Tax=Bugula neritina TaxID=10212 RepID=A0A7J7J3H7_BUGNE|nr:PKD1L2 [Bugula neritina]